MLLVHSLSQTSASVPQELQTTSRLPSERPVFSSLGCSLASEASKRRLCVQIYVQLRPAAQHRGRNTRAFVTAVLGGDQQRNTAAVPGALSVRLQERCCIRSLTVLTLEAQAANSYPGVQRRMDC